MIYVAVSRALQLGVTGSDANTITATRVADPGAGAWGPRRVCRRNTMRVCSRIVARAAAPPRRRSPAVLPRFQGQRHRELAAHTLPTVHRDAPAVQADDGVHHV